MWLLTLMMYHSATAQVLSISCKLKVSQSQAAKLDATLNAFVQALNWVNQNTPEKIVNTVKLQSLCYFAKAVSTASNVSTCCGDTSSLQDTVRI